MATRKIVSEGWLYRAARHARLGLVLVDETDQQDVPEGTLRAFVLETQQTARFDRREFRRSLGGEVSEDDCAGLLVRYRAFRRTLGRDAPAPPEIAHANRFRQHGLAAPGVRARAPGAAAQEKRCSACGAAPDPAVALECEQCGAPVCRCGACGCSLPSG